MPDTPRIPPPRRQSDSDGEDHWQQRAGGFRVGVGQHSFGVWGRDGILGGLMLALLVGTGYLAYLGVDAIGSFKEAMIDEAEERRTQHMQIQTAIQESLERQSVAMHQEMCIGQLSMEQRQMMREQMTRGQTPATVLLAWCPWLAWWGKS